MSHHYTSRSNSNDMPIGIPPNVLKNFNAYEVLTPVVVPLTNDAPLIDLDDTSSNNQSLNKKQDDENSGFNLIDVFENIYVTPQLVSKKPKGSSENTNIDYEDFFRKLDGRIMNEDVITSAATKPITLCQSDFENSLDKLARESKITEANNSNIVYGSNVHTADAQDHEDLIDELLLDRTLASMKITNENSTNNTSFTRVLKTPILQYNTPDLISSQRTLSNAKKSLLSKENNANKYSKNHEYDILSKNNRCEQTRSLKTDMQQKIEQKSSKLDQHLISDFLKSMECENIKLQYPNENSKCSPVNAYLFNIASSSSDSDSGISAKSSSNDKRKLADLRSSIIRSAESNTLKTSNVSIFNTGTDLQRMSAMPVQAIAKDNKAYKNRNMRNDLEKLTYTKGPDLNEKSIVLPQLLYRLGILKKDFDKNVNVKRRLILDVGSVKRNSEIPVKLEPTVLMEDCNRERYKDLRARQMLGKFVNNGTILQ